MWICWLLFAGRVQATPILDQQNAPSGNFPALAVANDRTQIQTFTVGVTGVLTRIDVQVSRETQTVEDLVLSLWSTDVTGLPKDLLATVSVPPSAIDLRSPTEPFVTFDLSAEAIAVSAGELLAILLNSNAQNNPPFFEERYLWEIGGQYDRGTAYTRLDTSFFEQSEDFHFRTYVEPAIIQVAIDIKPGSDTNPINPRSQGVIPVAILTTDTVDATSVNPATVRFGVTGTEAAPVRVAVEDVNGDGRPDLLFDFNTQDTGIQCGKTSASLTGQTFSGQAIKGTDAIQTVGCK
jgi:hypothetical protein